MLLEITSRNHLISITMYMSACNKLDWFSELKMTYLPAVESYIHIMWHKHFKKDESWSKTRGILAMMNYTNMNAHFPRISFIYDMYPHVCDLLKDVAQVYM